MLGLIKLLFVNIIYLLFLNFFALNANALEKVVILTFDDDWKTQYLYAKPILDKYGFKGTFFITCECINYKHWAVCNNSANPESVMTWNDVKSLQNEGHDIQSHGMTHRDLTSMSEHELEFEIDLSKHCLFSHNINSTIYANAFSTGWNNSTIINTIAKYYEMGRNGYDAITFLKCDGWKEIFNQLDCRTYLDNGTLTYANKYSIRVSSHNNFDQKYLHNGSEILNDFIKHVNKQTKYNTNSETNAIPILVYHNFDDVKRKFPNTENTLDINNNPITWTIHSTTDVNLFDKEMRYLYDNGFQILTMSELGYDDTNEQFFIK